MMDKNCGFNIRSTQVYTVQGTRTIQVLLAGEYLNPIYEIQPTYVYIYVYGCFYSKGETV